MAFLAALSTGVLACFLLFGQQGLDASQSRLHEMISISSDAAQIDSAVIESTTNMSQVLSSALADCSMDVNSELLIGKMLGTSVYATSVMQDFNSMMKFVPKLIWIGSMFDDAEEKMLYGACVPLVSILASCALLLLALNVFSCGGRDWVGRCTARMGGCLVDKIGVNFIVAAMLMISAVTSVEFGVGLSIGAFCRDVDDNALSVIRHYGGPRSYDVGSFYIKGNGSNIWFNEIAETNASLAEIAIAQHQFSAAQGCSRSTSVKVREALDSTSKRLFDLQHLLHPEHLYPLYHQMVHVGVCDYILNGLGWITFLQLMMGLISLPILSCMSKCFFEEKWNYAAATAPLVQQQHVTAKLPETSAEPPTPTSGS